ncbi:hypothetical protein [Ferruginibacter sp. SUN106]|uniref:hypothetical protein n=1 Tax=Ferruginibacter sp. SUN106 TaxID=2978348 RepID=UPI003D36F8E0
MKRVIFLFAGFIFSNTLFSQVSLKVLEKIVTANPVKVKKMLTDFNKESIEPGGNITWKKETAEVFEVVSRTSSSYDTLVNYQFSNATHFNTLFEAIKKSAGNKILLDKSDGSIRQIFLENKIYSYSLMVMGPKEKPYKYIVNIRRYKPHEPYDNDIRNEVKEKDSN